MSTTQMIAQRMSGSVSNPYRRPSRPLRDVCTDVELARNIVVIMFASDQEADK